MTPNLPEPLHEALRPLFEALPLNQAMDRLVVTEDGGRGAAHAGQATEGDDRGSAGRGGVVEQGHVALVEQVLADPRLRDKPALAAGLWLYVDQLERSHAVSQDLQTPTGSYWHAIMHRREGDFSNSHYWYRRTGHHPAMSRIDVGGGSAASGTTIGNYDPHQLVDHVARCLDQGPPERCHELVAVQRREWLALFEWCAEH